MTPPENEDIRSYYHDPFINELSIRIAAWRERKGFYSPRSFDETDQILVKLALVHSEISEAVEAVRTGNFDNFVEELADAVIRVFDASGTMGLDLAGAIADKMVKNEGRPHMHGKRA